MISITERELQHVCDKYVRHNVDVNQTSLVNDLLCSEQGQEMGFSYDNIQNLCLFDDQILENSGFEGTEHEQEGFIQEVRERGEDIQEILEWWQVSSHFLYHLRKYNEPILENDYGTWWGRTCTGQAISMDSIVRMMF